MGRVQNVIEGPLATSSGRRAPQFDDVRELEGMRRLELVECALARVLVGPPPQQSCRMPEAPFLELIEVHLGDQ